MIVVDRKKVIEYVPGLFGEKSTDASLTLLKSDQNIKVYELFDLKPALTGPLL